MNDNPLQTMWGLIGFFLIFGGLFMFIQWNNGGFAPEMQFGKKLEGTWIMLDESWQEEASARNRYGSIDFYAGVFLSGFSYSRHNEKTTGWFSIKGDPDQKMSGVNSCVITGNILTLNWKNGENNFRVYMENENLIGLQNATSPNGPIRWYRRR